MVATERERYLPEDVFKSLLPDRERGVQAFLQRNL